MSKTKLFILSVFFFVAYQGNAQIDLGIRFQTGLQNQQQTESTYLVGANKSVDYRLEFQNISNTQSVGAFSQINFGWLYLQPEVLYTRYDVNFLIEDFKSEKVGSAIYTENYQQIDIPINAGLRYNNFRIGGGPVFQLVQELNSELADLRDIELTPRNINAGFQGGIGFDWKILHFDIKYQRNFASVSDHISFGASSTKLKTTTSTLQFGIAMALGTEK
jgi:hypothetical protein